MQNKFEFRIYHFSILDTKVVCLDLLKNTK